MGKAVQRCGSRLQVQVGEMMWLGGIPHVWHAGLMNQKLHQKLGPRYRNPSIDEEDNKQATEGNDP